MATWAAGEELDATKLSTYAGSPTTRTSNVGTFTGTNTLTDTITVPLVSGRRYLIVWDGEFQSSVAADYVRSQIHEDSTSGTIIQLRQVYIPVINQAWPVIMQTLYTAVATGNKTFVAASRRLSGTGNITAIANSSSPTLFYVENA